jgi:hypothetical protein
MIAALFALVIFGYLFYYLFIVGIAWGILLFIFGVVGGRLLILNFIPQASKTIMTFMGNDISWATFVAAVISLLGVGYIMNQSE